MSKIWLDFGQLVSLNAIILGMDQDIKNVQQTWSKSIPASAGFSQKMVNFGPLTKKLQARMLNYSKLTMHILHMLLHLSSGHVTLQGWEF